MSILAACEKGGGFAFTKDKGSAGAEVNSLETPNASSVKLIERDVEAPEAFQASDQGLWDGRPSLGGVWVAHPDVKAPERVIIRNEENGKFVIGALFKRERDNPGPRIQVSSDAASALGMLAGAPDALNVTALRRQEVPVNDGPAAPVATGPEALPPPEAIQTASLDPIAAASAALDEVEASVAAAKPAVKPVQTASLAPTPTPKPAPAASKLREPIIQIGLFSEEQNATNTGAALRNAGILPTIKTHKSKGKTYYRVTIGPAPNSAERAAMLKKVKDLGYSDAYFVTN
ncbi:DedD protein [Candidatus Rhodobacter oscarellae]|uniref:DedD protein n=1 Tax=Candidatus Rhodobacter oscarellae TaxID=1675527 RepID=A0A0J9GVV4_9RHOB|nr:SPOR domain-containing protein [Candidatus Rhodobacter lobularis]KMW57698.1 DedD protein [Candidatus Rhodobacter lobularis]